MNCRVRSRVPRFLLLLFLSVPAPAQVSVLTYHNDNGRTGMNTNETMLTPGNVNTNTFGKLFSYNVDGQVYAQPLYIPGLTITGKGSHNVLFIATEHNSVYAFDADNTNNGAGGGLLWQTNLGTSAASGTTNFGGRSGPYNNIAPEVGITSTPVIDPVTGTIYVDAFTHDNVNDKTNYVHRLHALNIADGTERPYSPVVVAATFPGIGIGSIGGIQSFVAKQEIQRVAVTLAGGVVYLAFASYADTDPYHGWIIGYNATDLVQLTNSVFNSTPNSTNGPNPGEGGFWASGCGLAVDTDGNLLCATGNGSFTATNGSGGTEFGDTFLSLSTSNGLVVADYFTPYDQASLQASDLDIGSSGLLLLPEQPGPYPHLMVGGGKAGKLYLINRDQFTLNNNHFDSTNSVDYNVQSVTLSSGIFDTPTYLNGKIYIANSGSTLKAYSLSNGVMSTTAVSTSTRSYAHPGSTPIVSASGTNNGIVWALANANPAVLVAYNASNLTAEIYNSTQAAGNRDRLAAGIKFTSPIVADGKVFVGGQSQVSIFGLLNPTDISLSGASVPEAQPSGAVVGSLSTADANGAETFTYTLVSGTGSTDNGSFTLNGNTLQTVTTFSYAAQSSCSIRVRSTASSGRFVEKVFNITVIAVPTDIALSNVSVPEGRAVGATVGNLSTADSNGADTFTYTLVAGTGSTDNSSFSISSNALQTAAVFNYSVQNSFSVRVRSTAQSGQLVEKAFAIAVLSSNTPPVPVPVGDRTINAGVTLVITNVANDAESPPELLVFSLLNAPANATMTPRDSTSAVLTWRPLVSQADTTNVIGILVTDNGSPNLSATNSFTVTVNPLAPLSISSIAVAGSQMNLTASGPVGPDYTLLSSTNLSDWQVLAVTNSPVTPVTLWDTNVSDLARFYRIQIGP